MNRIAPLLRFLYKPQISELDRTSVTKCYMARELLRVHGSDITDQQLLETIDDLQTSLHNNTLEKIKNNITCL